MNLLEMAYTHFFPFVFVWARIVALAMLMPVMSAVYVPIRYRLLFSFVFALMIFPWYMRTFPVQEVPNSLILILKVLEQGLIGVLMGFVTAMIFASLQLGAQFFTAQIGLGMSEVFDPITQESSALLSYFFYTLGLSVFLMMGGMHMMFRAVVDSFTLMPDIELLQRSESLFILTLRYFKAMFVIGLQIALPVVISSSMVVIALGLVGKTAPQTNILILGLPIQFGLGMLMVYFMVPALIYLIRAVLENGLGDLMRYFAGRLA